MDAAGIHSIQTGTALIRAVLSLFDAEALRTLLQDCKDLDLKKISKAHARISLGDQLSILGHANDSLSRLSPRATADFCDAFLDNMVAHAVLAAPTPGDGMDVISEFAHLWCPALYAENFQDSRYRTLAFGVIDLCDQSLTQTKGLAALQEISLMAAYRLLGTCLDGSWHDAKIWMTGPTLSWQSQSHIIKIEIKYNSPRVAISLPSSLYMKNSVHANPIEYRKAKLNIHNYTMPRNPDRTLEKQVIAFINATQFHRPSIGDVAQHLGMSTRTLNRRLEETGSSFRELREYSLKNRAKQLLSQGRLSRGEISERLGYKDQASFSRAIRRWKAG